MWHDRLAREVMALNAAVRGCRQAPDTYADAVALWRAIYATEPDPWQVDVLRSRRPRLLLNCARQTGKSSVAAALGLFEVLCHPPALVLLLSASLRQAQELGAKVFGGYRALGRPVSAEAENRLSLELSNGSRLVCLPSKESTIRGFSGARLIVVDEAAYVMDNAYYAVRPMLAVSGGRLVLCSTPYGRRGFFWRAWEEEEAWEKVRVTAEQCPRITPAFLEEERRALGESWWKQEYFCSFEAVEGAVFDEEMLRDLIDPALQPLIAPASWQEESEWVGLSGLT